MKVRLFQTVFTLGGPGFSQTLDELAAPRQSSELL
jgi:hypothetical protein